ncbi:MAG: hypothetical protein HUN05_05230 [Desulfobacter sp.]|nr:MAG: hypothetical protein HUN05_05230 [Desulfobacter sp.]
MGFGPIDNRVSMLSTQDHEKKVQPFSPQKDEGSSSLVNKIGIFFKRVIGGRIGAKAGHHSALGSMFKIGLQQETGLNKVVKKPIAPTHTYTFNKLGKERAQYFKPWVTAAKIANAMDFPDSYKEADNNFGMLLRNSQ